MGNLSVVIQNEGVERVIEALRVELFKKRISQERLAIATGMSQSKISRRLSGDVPPSLAELEQMALAADLKLTVELRPLADGEASR